MCLSRIQTISDSFPNGSLPIKTNSSGKHNFSSKKKANGDVLHHRASGSHRHPAVLLLHGFLGSSRDWDEVAAALAGRRHCLAADLPGHGASTGLAAHAYTMDGAAQALADVLDARGVSTCAVVGYSMGGRLALYFALRFPERCRRLVLESASPGLAAGAERAARRRLDAARAARLEAGDFEAFLRDWYRQPLFASLAGHAGLAERMTAARRHNDPAELARSLRGMGTGRQPSLWERLPALAVATLAVAGALDHKYVEIAGRMAGASRCVRAVAVPEAGHNVHAEQPRRFLTLLRTFL